MRWGERLPAALGLQAGMSVADVGAGQGHFVPLWRDAVGPAGRVIAEDIDASELRHAKELIRERAWENVDVVIGSETEARLASNSCDLVVVVDAYHHFRFPKNMLASIEQALKLNGRLGIVEFHKLEKWTAGYPPPWHIRLDRNGLLQEVASYGWELVSCSDYVAERLYIAIFQPTRRTRA